MTQLSLPALNSHTQLLVPSSRPVPRWRTTAAPSKDVREQHKVEDMTPTALPYTFMIFKAITSFLRVETSSSCFFFSLCRNWM